MIQEILLVIVIILVLIVVLITFKQIHVYIRFKNDNRSYDGEVHIDYLIIKGYIDLKNLLLKINLELFKRSIPIRTINLRRNPDEEQESSDDQVQETIDEQVRVTKDKQVQEHSDEKEDLELREKLDDFKDELTKFYDLLIDARDDIFDLIKPITKVSKFQESIINLSMGLGDNNRTIKVCNNIWIASAILYPCNIKIFLTPEINNVTLKSDINVSFTISILNMLRLVFIMLTKKNLRNLLKEVYSLV